MWAFPLAAGAVALVFAARLAASFAARRRPYDAMWAVAMLMYGLASLAVVAGVVGGWSRAEYEIFWVLGAVLNVPFLAGGEIDLLARRPNVAAASWLLLVFVTAYAVAVTRNAAFEAAALAQDLPSGKDVFGDGSPAHRLPQLISIPSYLILVGGSLWSAWRMRGRPELRARAAGTLWIAAGATVIAGVGSAFAAAGNAAAFSVALLIGIGAMFWGFVGASGARSATAPEPAVARGLDRHPPAIR